MNPMTLKVTTGKLAVTPGNASSVRQHCGPSPIPFAPTTSADAGASTTIRKRVVARSYVNLLKDALGGQAGFETWMVDEMERAYGKQGLSSELRIFTPKLIDTILTSPVLRGHFKTKLDHLHRPRDSDFAISLRNISFQDVNKLRSLQPGFYPRNATIISERRRVKKTFIDAHLRGATQPAPTITLETEEVEGERHFSQAAEADMAEVEGREAALREADAFAAAEVAPPPPKAPRTDGSGGPAVNVQDEGGVDSDGEEPGDDDDKAPQMYCVQQMTSAHQCMVIARCPWDVPRLGYALGRRLFRSPARTRGMRQAIRTSAPLGATRFAVGSSSTSRMASLVPMLWIISSLMPRVALKHCRPCARWGEMALPFRRRSWCLSWRRRMRLCGMAVDWRR